MRTISLFFNVIFISFSLKIFALEKNENVAEVVEIQTSSRLKAKVVRGRFSPQEKLALVSKDPAVGIYGFLSVLDVESANKVGELPHLILEVVGLSKRHLVQYGDQLIRLDLSQEQPEYRGSTELLVHHSENRVSSRYKPLFTQGFSIGETAETLNKDEFFVSYFGQLQFGFFDNLTVGTVAPLNAVGAGNASAKLRIYHSEANVVAVGLTFAKIPNTDESTLNVNFMWDSFSNSSVVTHNFITLAVLTFKKAEEASALRSIGTSSLQTGYEFIFDGWSRVLLGPNYNFESKTIGGYISYLKIWNRFHLQFSLNSTNIRSLKLSPTDGYYGFLDAYWRF